MATVIHQNEKIQIGEWSNSEIDHSLQNWPFVGPDRVCPKSAEHTHCVNLDVENRRLLRKNSFAVLPCTENVCKWLIDAAIQYVGRYPVERKVIWSDRNSEISFIKLNK